jgi:hypothetical protein
MHARRAATRARATRLPTASYVAAELLPAVGSTSIVGRLRDTAQSSPRGARRPHLAMAAPPALVEIPAQLRVAATRFVPGRREDGPNGQWPCADSICPHARICKIRRILHFRPRRPNSFRGNNYNMENQYYCTIVLYLCL